MWFVLDSANRGDSVFQWRLAKHNRRLCWATVHSVLFALVAVFQVTSAFAQFDLQITVNKPFFVNNQRAAQIE